MIEQLILFLEAKTTPMKHVNNLPFESFSSHYQNIVDKYDHSRNIALFHTYRTLRLVYLCNIKLCINTNTSACRHLQPRVCMCDRPWHVVFKFYVSSLLPTRASSSVALFINSSKTCIFQCLILWWSSVEGHILSLARPYQTHSSSVKIYTFVLIHTIMREGISPSSCEINLE